MDKDQKILQCGRGKMSSISKTWIGLYPIMDQITDQKKKVWKIENIKLYLE